MKVLITDEDRWVCKLCGRKNCSRSDEEVEYCATDDYSSEMLAKFYEERKVDDEK